MENYYKDLNLPAPSHISEVKKAYRELAKKYHPDKNTENVSSVQSFLKINKAYEFLKDKNRKIQYDGNFILYKKKGKIQHHPALIKDYIRKNPRHKSKIIFGQKIRLKIQQCEKCEGYGQLLTRFSFPAICPQCDGTGKK